MAKKKVIVTNAMRILDKAKIKYETMEYEHEGEIGADFGMEIAKKTGVSPKQSFKTLVLKGDKKGIMVACVPVDGEIDLKKMAMVSGDKKVEMIHVKDLLNLTGYIRGGVSPIGMKKNYPTYIDKSCLLYDDIAISAGVCGCSLKLSPVDLIKMVNAVAEDIKK